MKTIEFKGKRNIDKINHKSSHSVVSTRSGGIAILVTLLITSTVFYINGFELYNYSLLIPIIILGVVGIYDDIHSVDFKLIWHLPKTLKDILCLKFNSSYP